MCRPIRPSRPGCCSWGALLLAALALTIPAAALLASSAPAGEPAPLVPPGAARAEIHLAGPVRYAVVRQEPGEVRRLVTRGDILFHPQDALRSWTVEQVEPGVLLLRAGPRGRPQALQSGSPIPGFPGWSFTGTVLLEQLQYRYKVVERIAHPDPVLISLEGSRAILEVETLRPPADVEGISSEVAAPPGVAPSPPARATLDGELLAKVQIQETGPGLYEVNAVDVQAALDNAGRVLTDLWLTVQPTLSFQTGLEYRITSAASDGVLSGHGFTVTAPKLAERAGLQVGDTILSVNGQPVDGFASLYGIFRAVRRDPALSTVQVELDRGGTRLTKTYRIR